MQRRLPPLPGLLLVGCAGLLDLDEYEPAARGPRTAAETPPESDGARAEAVPSENGGSPSERAPASAGDSPTAPESAATPAPLDPGAPLATQISRIHTYIRDKGAEPATSYSVRAAEGLLGGAPELVRDAITVIPASIQTDAGGAAEVSADGSFVYFPPSLRFFGDDRFRFAFTSAAFEEVGTVRFTLRPAGAVRLQDVGEATGTGFRIIPGDAAVRALARAGDVNGDGLADIIVGVPERDERAGGAYVLFGKREARDVRLAELDGGLAGGFALSGAPAGARAGAAIAGGGDFDGDGLDDLLIGAPDYDGSPAGDEGAVFLVSGRPGTVPVDLELWRAGSERSERFGAAIAAIGDINGDGVCDFAVGSPGANGGAGQVTVFLGGTFTALPLYGDIRGGAAGAAVSRAGDLNGDGFDDLLVAAPLARAREADAVDAGGIIYDVPGTNFSFSSALADHHYFYGGTVDGRYGSALTGAGDIDGDGRDEIVLLSPGVPSGDIWQQDAAGTYHLRWSFEYERAFADPFATSHGYVDGDARSDLVISADQNVYVLPGTTTAMFWCLAALSDSTNSCGTPFGSLAVQSELPLTTSAVSAGDVNGDGLDDLVLSTGDMSYVLFSWHSATDARVPGIEPINRFANRDGALRGGAEDDRLIYDGTHVRVDGGLGRDTLVVLTPELNLANRSILVRSIEIVDLRGNGAQLLILDDASVRRTPEYDSEAPSGVVKALTLLGDADDAVVLSGARPYFTAGYLPDGSFLLRAELASYGVVVSPEVEVLMP